MGLAKDCGMVKYTGIINKPFTMGKYGGCELPRADCYAALNSSCGNKSHVYVYIILLRPNRSFILYSCTVAPTPFLVIGLATLATGDNFLIQSRKVAGSCGL